MNTSSLGPPQLPDSVGVYIVPHLSSNRPCCCEKFGGEIPLERIQSFLCAHKINAAHFHSSSSQIKKPVTLLAALQTKGGAAPSDSQKGCDYSTSLTL